MAENVVPEEWREIEGWLGYEVSSLGRIRKTVSYQIILKQQVSQRGYHTIAFATREKLGTYRVARLVCTAFHGAAPSPYHQAAHGNRDPSDNSSKNLRWATPTENSNDKVIHGTSLRGEANPRSKITEEDVRTIRRLAAEGNLPLATIGRKFGIRGITVQRIVNRLTWAWLA